MSLRPFRQLSLRRVRRFPGSVMISLSAIVITTVLMMSMGCGIGPTETQEYTFTVGDSVKVIVNSENSSIVVNAGPEEEVNVKATLRGTDRLDYEINQEGDTITIKIEVDTTWLSWGRGASADIAITSPVNTEVEIDTSNGSIELDGIEGAVSTKSTNGRIVLENVKGDLNAETTNGRIKVDTLEGAAVLKSSNGSADVQNIVGEIDIETSNGRISFSGELIPGGNNRLVTSNGAVVAKLQGNPSVSLDAETSNGDVESELAITVTSMGDDRLVGTIGDGEADLYIRTSNGDVTIK